MVITSQTKSHSSRSRLHNMCKSNHTPCLHGTHLVYSLLIVTIVSQQNQNAGPDINVSAQLISQLAPEA